MRSPDWEKYVKDILSHVKFKYDHKYIYSEIMEHMEDLYNNLVNEGIDENEAIKLTVEYMGDSEEIGKALNKEHNPFVGWIYRILKYFAMLLIFLNISTVFIFIFSSINNFVTVNENVEKYGQKIEFIQEIDEKRKIDNTYIFLDKIVRYDNGDIKILYSLFKNPFSYGTKFTNGDILKIYDENNNEYIFRRRSPNKKYYSYYEYTIDNFPKNEEKLIIKYGDRKEEYTVEISMKKGGIYEQK